MERSHALKVLQEVESYCKLKTDIKNQAKNKVKQITKEQREELLERGRKRDKEDFLRQIASTSGTQGFKCKEAEMPSLFQCYLKHEATLFHTM